MLRPTAYQKLLSWLYPVRIKRLSSKIHPILEIFLFRDEWQLATEDAIYSDGSRYRPLVEAFRIIKTSLSNQSKIIVLGSGLGSAISVLKKMGINPSVLLVDNDEEIIRINKEWRWKDCANYEFFFEDAFEFIANANFQFDILVIDVFKDRIVPDFVTKKKFLLTCKQKTKKQGKIILNYILNNHEEWKLLEKNFSEIFPQNQIISFGINKIFIATV